MLLVNLLGRLLYTRTRIAMLKRGMGYNSSSVDWGLKWIGRGGGGCCCRLRVVDATVCGGVQQQYDTYDSTCTCTTSISAATAAGEELPLSERVGSYTQNDALVCWFQLNTAVPGTAVSTE